MEKFFLMRMFSRRMQLNNLDEKKKLFRRLIFLDLNVWPRATEYSISRQKNLYKNLVFMFEYTTNKIILLQMALLVKSFMSGCSVVKPQSESKHVCLVNIQKNR